MRYHTILVELTLTLVVVLIWLSIRDDGTLGSIDVPTTKVCSSPGVREFDWVKVRVNLKLCTAPITRISSSSQAQR